MTRPAPDLLATWDDLLENIARGLIPQETRRAWMSTLSDEELESVFLLIQERAERGDWSAAA